MKIYLFSLLVIHSLFRSETSKCGCRSLTQCYIEMLNTLHDENEAYCVQDAAIGTSSLTIFLKALNKYCSESVYVSVSELLTYDSRHLYQVVVSSNDHEGKEAKPTVIIDAGQDAGSETVRFALYIIEQLVACEENAEMIQKVKWVILPSTNPDGIEYARYDFKGWRKNLRVAEDDLSYGVDITRNFDQHWGACHRATAGFSPIYPGTAAGSENETAFIKNVLSNYLDDAKIYVSLRRDGHHIGYPYAFSSNSQKNAAQLSKLAAEVTSRVNLRSNGINLFANNSIFELNGKPHCGHSVDYAFDLGIYLAYEMGIFLESGNSIVSHFHAMPLGYENSLRSGYFSGIREFYNALTNEKKYGKVY